MRKIFFYFFEFVVISNVILAVIIVLCIPTFIGFKLDRKTAIGKMTLTNIFYILVFAISIVLILENNNISPWEDKLTEYPA